jgi:hypothetical protein
MPLTRAQVTAIAEKARKMPPAPPAEANVTKQEAVRLLVPVIEGLQRKGYKLDQIVESFRGDGLDLTTATMKSYLSRAKASRQRRRDTPQRAPAAPKATPQFTPKEARPSTTKQAAPFTNAEAAPSTVANAPTKSGKDAFLVKDKDSY